jgi:hypothetical protein
MASYFGEISLKVLPGPDGKTIRASLHCDPERKPSTVILRIPHPGGHIAKQVSLGIYDPASETVKIESFTGNAEVTLQY